MYNILYNIKLINTLNQKRQYQHIQQHIQQHRQHHLITQFKQTTIFNSIIPLNIFQTWHTLKLPNDMNNNSILLKKQNPEFTYYLYDDNMCRDFISTNFDKDVLYAYDTLKPGAYKADLWRYCILYKYGGIYLDVKYKSINNFKLIKLTDKEYFCRESNNGIYQAILCCLPNNPILYKCIQEIIINTKYKNYTSNYLSVTGPQLNALVSTFNNKTLELLLVHGICDSISKNNIPILIMYSTYRDEQLKYQLLPHYKILWNSRDIYNYQPQQIITHLQQTDISTSVIPLNLFQTWHTLKLPQDMNKNMLLLKQQNPEFTHYLYDDSMCRNFISNNFDKDALYAYDTLKPGAYKADLWRYCILYKYGGIYLDIKYSCINNFKLINLTDKEYFCSSHHNGIYQAILCCLPNNPILYKCIQEIIINTKTKDFTNNTLSVTGPQLNTFMTTFNNVDLELKYEYGFSNNIISKNNSHILKSYDTYRDEQRKNQLLPDYTTMYMSGDIYN